MPIIQCWDYDAIEADLDDDYTYEDLDELLDDLNIEGQKGWHVCGILRGDIIIIERASDGIKKHTGAGTRRKRPDRGRNDKSI